ncbi:MAG: hypothetical protein ACR2RV_02655 [Verrucomicrobiales bacterium]
MKIPVFVLAASLALLSCKTTPVPEVGADPNRDPEISFVKKGGFGRGAGLFLRVDGREHLVVENVSKFNRLERVSYMHTNIPSYAEIAGQYWVKGGARDERYIIYADHGRGEVRVFSFRYRPGSQGGYGRSKLGSFPY